MLLIIKYRSGTFVIHFRARECERAVSEINGTFCHNNKSYLLIFSYTIIITCPLFFFHLSTTISQINCRWIFIICIPDNIRQNVHKKWLPQKNAQKA